MAKKFYQDCQAGDLDAVEKFLSSENVNGNKINELVFDDGLGFKATPLHAAVESGNNQLVRTLLQHGGNPSIQDGQKYTCLMLACSLGKIDIVRVLMDHGVEIIPSKSSGLKSTPLHEAVMANNVEIVETLLSVEPKLLELTDNRKWTALHFACQYGKPEVAKVLMEKGANIDAQIDIRRTPLHLAAFEGYPECIEHLLEKGADPNIQSEGNWTPLILAAQEGKTRCAELLLGDPRININLRASNGRNALHSASFYGRVEIAQMLIDKGIECHVPDKDKWTQLHLCCQEKHPDIVKCILNSGKMVDINAKSHNGRTPLHSAALKGSSEAVRLLIDSGAKVDEADNKDWTPLHVACQHGHTAVVEILIRAGADPNKLISMGRNALHLAAFEGRVQIAEMLLENSVKVHVPDKDLWTPLHLATQEGKTPIALMILKRREANINAQAHNGRTPLHSAAFYGRKDLVKALLDHGANTYVQDEKGWSQLHLAAQEGHLEIVEMLVTMGAPVNAQSDNLRTPIHLACMRSHTQIVSYLITHSADLSLKDSKQWTCLHVAYHHKRQEVFRILLEHGIPVNAQTDEGRTCLHMLCSHYDGSHYYIEQLLKHNANIGIKDKDGNTPLHLAAASNAPDIVDRLLQKAADVESENYSGMRPLSLGIGHINIVRKLIESGADVGACDKQGMTALHQACAKQSINVSVVQELLKCDKALVNRLTNAGSSPLHLACQSNNKKQVVQYLLDNGANVDEANTEGYTPVLYAARYGSAEVVKSLIAAKADHKARTKKGETALHMACYGGNVDIVRTILDLSIPINACDFEKRSALLVASSRGHTGVVSVLLEKKANTSLVTGGGQNALHIASEKHHRSVCELLIKAGVNIKAKDSKGFTALHTAAELGFCDIAKDLVTAGAVIECSDATGATPLLLACRNGRVDMGQYLIGQGANCGSKDNNGFTPLMESALAGILDLVTVLVNREVDLDVSCYTTLETALHFAVANAHLEVAEFLAKRGASLSKQNRSGNTPLHLAVSRGYLPLVQFFLECPSADLSLRNTLGQSLLMLAIRGCHTCVANFLIEQGALLFVDQLEYASLIELVTSEGLDDVLAAILASDEIGEALAG